MQELLFTEVAQPPTFTVGQPVVTTTRFGDYEAGSEGTVVSIEDFGALPSLYLIDLGDGLPRPFYEKQISAK